MNKFNFFSGREAEQFNLYRIPKLLFTDKRFAKVSAEATKSRMLKLNCSHIQYVLDCLRNNTTQVRNIKNYLIATLYNAPATIGCYYTLAVNYDMNKV